MTPGLSITIVDPDDDYTGVEIQACNDRFAGSARIYAGLLELTQFAAKLVGFPKDHSDQKIHEFGSRGHQTAGGHCRIHFRCLDRAGHIAIDIELKEDDIWWFGGSRSSVQLTLRVEAAGIDSFIERLRAIDCKRRGTAVLVECFT
jgi:hypothetical protein